ncbi:MAG: DNA polymerase III subunit delta' [bacterium]
MPEAIRMSFSQIVGQDRAVRFLQVSLLKGAISHAYIFTGPDGVGKKLTAFGLAKAVNCLQRKGDYCGLCDSCRRIDKGIHPDLFLVEPDGVTLKVEQFRDLQAAIRYRPYLARRKVCIIDQADRMSASAANSMLKTLEEPPADMLLILVTGSLDKILPTIRSRCRIVQFSPLPNHDLERLIAERMALPPDTARLVAHLAGGSLGKAQTLDVAGLQEKREEIFHLLESLGSSAGIEVLFSQAKKLADNKDPDSLQQLLDLWIYWYYDLWKYKITRDGDSLINNDRIENIHQQSRTLPIRQIEKNLHQIEETCAALQRNVNKQLALETMMMRLAASSE